MRSAGLLIVILLAATPFLAAADFPESGSATGKESSGDIWNDFAGIGDELSAEELELRDEPIAANISRLAALGKALDEFDRIPAGLPRRRLALARIGYLLEASFRLLADSGEYEAFLAVTERLRPPPLSGLEFPPALEAGREDKTPGSGLIFSDEDGNRLFPALVNGEWTLVDAETTRPPMPEREIAASPEGGTANAADDDFQRLQGRAAWLRAAILERMGRAEEARKETGCLGLIRDWLLLCPLDPDEEISLTGPKGLLEPSCGETGYSCFSGLNGPVFWRPFRSIDPLGRLLPGALFRSSGVKSACAVALIFSPRDMEASLCFGNSSPTEVGVNGWSVRRERIGGEPEPDQDTVDVWLRKGWNALIVMMRSSPGNWGFVARVTAPDGKALSPLAARPNPENMTFFLAEATRAIRNAILDLHYRRSGLYRHDYLSVLAGHLGENPEDARAAFYLASLLASQRTVDSEDRFTREELFQEAVEHSNENPFFALSAARNVDYGQDGPNREENQRLGLLRRAADSGSVAALVDIGRLYLDVMHQPRLAAVEAARALEFNRMSPRAKMLEYDAAENRGWRPAATAILQSMLRDHPASAAVRLRGGRAALAAGNPRQALSDFHAVLAKNAGNREALDGAVATLGLLGQTSAAVDLMIKHAANFPYDRETRLKLAGLYRSLGRDDDAKRALDDALELAPDDPAALAMRSDMNRKTWTGVDDPEWRRVGSGQQELDMSAPRKQPPDDWEYLYFQVADRLGEDRSVESRISFAIKIHSMRAARNLRQISFWLETGLKHGSVARIEIINGSERESFTPPAAGIGGKSLDFFLPPLAKGSILEAEVKLAPQRLPSLDDYFERTVSFAQSAPVRKSRYIFIAPRDTRVYFRSINGAPDALGPFSEGTSVARIWEMDDLPPFVPEPNSPNQTEIVPSILISSHQSWDEFAKWYWRLIENQYRSPPELRRLASAIGNGQEKPMNRLFVAARWISREIGRREWEFGPYAFRPLSARSILSRMSADGKDRSLLLSVWAGEYGLEAWPVLARLRSRLHKPGGSADLSFPLLDNFNHSLVAVTGENGTLSFLDASNPNRPPEVPPGQLSGSRAIIIRPAGGEIMEFPDIGSAACLWEDTADLIVDEDGSALWEEDATGTGAAAEMLRARFAAPDSRTSAWESFLAAQCAHPTAAWTDFTENPQFPASASFAGRSRLRRLAVKRDGRTILRIPPFPGTASADRGSFPFPLSLDEMAVPGIRNQDLVMPYGFAIKRRIRVRYPEDWRLLNPVSPFRREYPFGILSLAANGPAGVLHIEFSVEIPRHRLAVGDFSAFREMAALCKRWIEPILVWETP